MQATADKIWISAQSKLRSMLSADTFNLWFAPLRAGALDANGISLDVANDFSEVWLKDNYQGLLEDVLAQAAGRPVQVRFNVTPGSAPAPQATRAGTAKSKTAGAPAERTSTNEHYFNTKNTFDTFVVGNNKDRKSTRLNSSH